MGLKWGCLEHLLALAAQIFVLIGLCGLRKIIQKLILILLIASWLRKLIPKMKRILKGNAGSV